MKQIVDQGKDDITGMLRNIKEPMLRGARVIGDPKITAILAVEE